MAYLWGICSAEFVQDALLDCLNSLGSWTCNKDDLLRDDGVGGDMDAMESKLSGVGMPPLEAIVEPKIVSSSQCLSYLRLYNVAPGKTEPILSG